MSKIVIYDIPEKGVPLERNKEFNQICEALSNIILNGELTFKWIGSFMSATYKDRQDPTFHVEIPATSMRSMLMYMPSVLEQIKKERKAK